MNGVKLYAANKRSAKADQEALEAISWHWRPRYAQARYCSHNTLMYSYAGWATR